MNAAKLADAVVERVHRRVARRWIVRNAILTPTCGNGVWAWAATRRGAERERAYFLTYGRRRGAHSSIRVAMPEGGLIVCRATEAGPAARRIASPVR